MGTSSSKESSSSKSASSSLPFVQWQGIQRTQCDAPPPLPPPGAVPPPPPPVEKTTTAAPPPPPAADAGTPPSETNNNIENDSIASAAAMVSSVPNPGPYEQASMDCKRLTTLDTFDGMRVDINKQLSPFMAVVHSFWLGTSMIPDGRNRTYTFLTQVADESGLLMARIDPERGSVDGRIHRALLGGLAMGKVQMGVSAPGGDEQQSANDQLLAEMDFGGLSWTGNLKYGSMGGGLVFGCNYFQSITPRLAMGGEGMYISANSNLLSNYTLKYTMPVSSGAGEDDEDDDIAAAAKSQVGGGAPPSEGAAPSGPTATMVANYNSAQGLLALNYKRDVTPNRVTLGAELQCSPMTLESQVMVGAEFKLTRSKMAICVDGTGRVQSCLEAKLGMQPGSPTLNFSAELDHAKDSMKFGYGINIDG